MSVVNPIGLLTNHLTGSPPVMRVVENPASGIGHSGNAPTGVIDVIGPSVGPITIVLVTQSFSSAPNSHVTGLTSKSKLPYQPTFQVNDSSIWVYYSRRTDRRTSSRKNIIYSPF